jgi:damage-control phosphatase, subfamily III
MGSQSDAESVRSVWTSDEGTMAKETAARRWPVIVQGMIDDVHLTCEKKNSESGETEGIQIASQLYHLKHDIMADAVLE